MKKMLLMLLTVILLQSCEEILMEEDISEQVVALTAPVNNAQFFSTGITFSWEPVEAATGYRIQIARPNFETPLQILSDETVSATNFTTQLTPGVYQWRVKAVNSSYTTAYTTRSFTVVSNENFQENSVALVSPVDNLLTNQAGQVLTWQQVIGATGYRLQIVNTTTGTIAAEQDLPGTSYTYTFTQGQYQWKVRATNGNQNTIYSARSLIVDTTSPNTPQLTAPANLYNSSNNEVSFQWTRTPIAGSAERDSLYIYSNSALTSLQYKNVQNSPYTNSALPDGTYYWFVRSFDAAGNAGTQSTVYSFTLN